MKNYQIKKLTQRTIQHYSDRPQQYWEGTKDHDVLQNITALLSSIKSDKPYTILDFGCGPGRDLKKFTDMGHKAYGLDGCEDFCRMAEEFSGCEVYHQDFIEAHLKSLFFDGIFANASLFHVPKVHLSSLIKTFYDSLVPSGVFLSSNPRGNGEDFSGTRYGNYMELEEYKQIVEEQGFKLIDHYYRPEALPKEQCPWLACIFRKTD